MANGNLLRSILQAIPFTVYTLDVATRQLTFLNKETFLGYAPDELKAQDSFLRAALTLLGETTVDVYLNDHAFWANVPINVWEYTIGGYQVLKKWLSYREQKVLGRTLTLDEVRAVTHIARRIAAQLLQQPQLDANYQQVKDGTHL